MKRYLILMISMMLLLAACGSSETPTSEVQEPPPDEAGGEVVGVPTAVPPSDLTEVSVDQITDITWQWVGHTEVTPAFQGVVPDPENYTIVFSPDGTVHLRMEPQ